VSLPGNEIYEALNQGVIDCNLHTFSMLSALSLNEVTTDITVGVPGGVYAGFSLNSMNADDWRSLNDKQREAMLRSSAVLSAYYTWLHIEEGAEYLAKARSSEDINVHQAEADIVEHTRQFVRDDTPAMAAIYRDEHNVENAEILVEEFLPVLDKWIELVSESDVSNARELADLYWKEAYSKADFSTYGMK
jgi:TRAP-type C4-dicarboxylate transport system substrate-binding protein